MNYKEKVDLFIQEKKPWSQSWDALYRFASYLDQLSKEEKHTCDACRRCGNTIGCKHCNSCGGFLSECTCPQQTEHRKDLCGVSMGDHSECAYPKNNCPVHPNSHQPECEHEWGEYAGCQNMYCYKCGSELKMSVHPATSASKSKPQKIEPLPNKYTTEPFYAERIMWVKINELIEAWNNLLKHE